MAEVRGDYDVVLLGTGKDGCGDARNAGRDSYAWSINMDGRSGSFVPSAAYTRVLATNTFSPVPFMSEWNTASPGSPILIWLGGDNAGNATVYEWIDGTATETDFDTPKFTGGALYRFDQDSTEDPDEEMMFFCNGYDKNIIVRRKKGTASALIDTGATTTHTAKADLLGVVGSDLFRVFHDYKLGKLTARTDPGILGNYPTDTASIPAGVPSFPINSVLSLGGSAIVTTGVGVHKYNPAPTVATFGNVLEFRSPHPDNGKVATTDGRGRLYVATVQPSELIVITFGFQQTHTPWKNKAIDRNTPRGNFSAIAVDLKETYLAIEPGTANLTQDGVGLVVKEDNGGVFTTHTTAVTSRKYSSPASVVLLTTGDFIHIGTSEPHMGARILLAGVRDSETAASALGVSFSTGTSTFASATPMDSTLTFAQDGLISMHKDFQHPFDVASSPWAKGTVDSVQDLYWMRIEPNSTLTGVTIREIEVIPYRPPLTADKNATTDAARMSGYKQAGALPTILKGHWQGERLIWHDWATLWTSKIESMVVGRVNDGVTDSDRALYMVSHDGLYAIPVGDDGDPSTASWPNLGHADSITAGLNDHLIATSANDFDLPAFPKTVNQLIVRGHHLQDADDELYLWYRMEHEPEWHQEGPFAQFPVAIKDLGAGKTLQVVAGYKDGSRDAIAPQIDSIIVPKGKWTYEDEELIDELEEAIASPQAN